jgi:glycine cleavage system H protein
MGEWKIPDGLKYSGSDEWVRIDGDTATIGISDYAQDQLNDIVYVELPEIDDEIAKGDSFGTVESVKAASDMYTGVGGVVVAINEALEDEPELINVDPYGKGWMIKLRVTDDSGLGEMMDAPAYAEYCDSR